MASPRSDPVPVELGLPSSISIREVGPRDGLQPEAPISVENRLELIHELVAAGIRQIEVAAFVSPKAVPAMAGAAEIFAGLERTEGVTYAALVPNLRGAQMALDSGADQITVTISASPGYSERNVKMTPAESESQIADIVAAVGSSGPHAPTVDAVISCAFGSPYEDDTDPAEVVAMGRRLLDSGVDQITYADTTGMATPRRVADLVDASDAQVSGLGLHLHDTRGTALVNAYAATQLGITRFDTAVGGLGGSPFAEGAGGNLATESLVAMLDDLDVATGIDLRGLLRATELLESMVGRQLPSGVARHGPRRPL